MLNMAFLEWEWLKFYQTSIFLQVTNILGTFVYILFRAYISYKKYIVLTLVSAFIFCGEVQFTCNIMELLLLSFAWKWTCNKVSFVDFKLAC
jgi:hypothetical protein